jgi:hypothetical protein
MQSSVRPGGFGTIIAEAHDTPLKRWGQVFRFEFLSLFQAHPFKIQI